VRRPATGLLLADELFLIVHDDTSGRPRTHPRVAGLGLGAALLAELVLFGSINVASGALTVLDRRPPADALAHTVLDQLLGEPQHRAVRVWLDFLAQTAADTVAQRMMRSGLVSRAETRKLWRTAVAYKAVDVNLAAWPEARLRGLLSRRAQMTVTDVTLLALIVAVGLARKFLADTDHQAPRHLMDLIDALPAPLRELAAQTEAAVGAAVLNPRT
jgi:hypothetical protein